MTAWLWVGVILVVLPGCNRGGNDYGTDCGGCNENQSCCDWVSEDDGDGGMRVLAEQPMCVTKLKDGKHVLPDGAVGMCGQKL